MSDVTPPVAPSATPDPTPAPDPVERAVEAGDLSTYRAIRQAERAGKPYEPADQPADPAPAQPDDQAASTEASPAPASEPGKPSGHKGNADTRKAQLQAEINDLLAQRARLRQELAPAPQPTKPAESAPATPQGDPEPQLADFEADADKYPDPYLAYTKAVARWEARQEHAAMQAKARAEAEAAERTKSLEQRDTQFRDRLAAEHAKDPAWLDAISEDVKGLRPFNALGPGETPTGYNAVAEEIVRSERPADLMRHFSDHPEELRRIAALPPRELLREMGKLDARLDAPPAVPPKTITSAPPPPPTVGTRVTEPVDDLQAAVVSGDVVAYRKARMRERLAQLR